MHVPPARKPLGRGTENTCTVPGQDAAALNGSLIGSHRGVADSSKSTLRCGNLSSPCPGSTRAVGVAAEHAARLLARRPTGIGVIANRRPG